MFLYKFVDLSFFLRDLGVVVIQVMNLVLQEVIQLCGPKWSDKGVVVIVLC